LLSSQEYAMSRRSNSLIPAYLGDDDVQVLSSLALASQTADQVAARHVFEGYLERISPSTRRRHAADLASFTEYLAEAGVAGVTPIALQHDPTAWREVSWGLVKGFARWLLNAGYAIRTVNARLSAIKVYAALAHEAGVLDQEAYSRIQLVKGYGRKQGRHSDEQREKQEIPTRVGAKKAEATSIPDDIAHDLKQRHEDTPQGRRDALLMCLLLDHGLRCSEVADLRVEHFNLAEGSFTFYRRKVDLTQTHRMTRDTRLAAQAYLTHDALPSGPLLRASNKHGSLGHAGLTTRAITKRVHELGERLGLRTLSAHDCRHYWATTAVRNGTHVKDLQEAGGWASPAMPLAYAERAAIANEGVKLGKG
jgi:integrase